MTAYYGDKIVKGVYFGTQNTNCLTEIPQDIDLRFKEFVQPVLTENGTMGGDSFACDQSNYYTENSGDEQKAWYVFDGKFNGQEWQVNGVKLDTWYWLSWYNPQPIKMSKVGVTNAAGQYSILAWKLQGSNDNSTWTDLATGTNENVSFVTTWYMEIPEEKQGFYKYYRIYCQPRVTTALMIRELTLTAVEPTIVLKAGSKLTWGGTEYRTTTTTADQTYSYSGTIEGEALIFSARSNGAIQGPVVLSKTSSGTLENRPTTAKIGDVYYSTDDMQFHYRGSSGWSEWPVAYPLALVTIARGKITSLDKVFNDFGFIGSTFYALPGVKGFNPNGFENGAYANRERTLGNVAIYTNKAYVSEPAFGLDSNAITRWSGGYEEVNELSDVINPLQNRRYYVKSENKIYNWTGSAWAQEDYVFAGYLTMDSTAPYNITSLTVNPVQPEKTSRKINFIYKGSTRVYMDVPPVTFNVSSEIQKYVVPNGVNKLRVVCVASKGYGEYGGNGGKVECDLTVTQGQTLYITVGAIPTQGISYPEYNASDVRIGGTTYSNRVIVAGGGGNQANSNAVGGAGGGLTGGDGGKGYGADSMGKGGTQTAGGVGGLGVPVSVGHYHNGEQGTLGLGGAGSYETGYEGPSGAGGAGYYGGGGGAGDWNKSGSYTAGGGGGSSFTDNSLCSNVTHTQGFIAGEGYITLTAI